MNSGDLLISLQKICVLVTITYFASRTDAFARLLLRDTRRKDQPWIFLVFSPLALGEVVLAPHNPAMDARVVSATAAGLFGGPLLGVWTGVVSWAAGSVHMPWSPLSGLPAAVAGALAGLFYRYGSPFVPTVIAGFLVGTLGHGLWLGIALPRVYLVGSWDTLVVQYMLPMLVSGLGAALFLVIIGDVRTQRERLERSELARAIALANRVLPNLRAGLDETAARHIAELVRRLTGLSAVAIAVADKLLAYVSEGEDRYRETALVPTAAIQAMRDGQRHSSDKRSGRCSALG
ncbi:MAG: LytS/YhcK type 5TM receptor domain-containing protein, partial [Armatimonadota bacterium]